MTNHPKRARYDACGALTALLVASVAVGWLPARALQAESPPSEVTAIPDAIGCAPDSSMFGHAEHAAGEPERTSRPDTADVQPHASSDGGGVVLDGTWRRLSRSPIRAQDALGVWTGDELLVLAGDRMAAYDPQTDRWRRLHDAPGRLGDTSQSVAVWSGDEWLVWSDSGGYSYHPDTDTWRQLPAAPFPGPIVDGVQADSSAAVVSSSGETAVYEPGRDCWWLLPSPDAQDRNAAADEETRPRTLFWTGQDLLLLTWHPPVDPNVARGESKLWRLDGETDRWVDTGPTPLSGGWPGGVWTGAELLFLGGPRDATGSASGAAYDPISGAWREFRQECGPGTQDATWTGSLLLTQWSALNPTDLTCFRIPESRDRARYGPVTVWTGDELIIWSGGRGEGQGARADGVRFRPRPRPADDGVGDPS